MSHNICFLFISKDGSTSLWNPDLTSSPQQRRMSRHADTLNVVDLPSSWPKKRYKKRYAPGATGRSAVHEHLRNCGCSIYTTGNWKHLYSKRRICQNCFRTKGASRDYHRVMRESLEYKAMPDQNCQRSSALAHHHSDSKIYSFGSTNPQLAPPIPPVSRFDWDGADALQGIPDDGARLDVVQNKTLGVQKRSLPGN